MVKINRFFVWMLLAALIAAISAGCGERQTADQPAAPAIGQTPSSSSSIQTPADAQEPAAPGANSGAQDADSGAIRVSTVLELLEAIAPDAKIVLEPGRYNLTDFLQDYPNAGDQDAWDDAHPYVKLSTVFDGVEVTIRDVSGLSVSGDALDPAETEIVTEPRYAAVLNFENCADVELACLTMGHTETGDCSGNVLDFDNCQNIYLRTMDLYGCGVYGIQAEGCGNLTVSNSTIRDCEYGPISISGSTDDILFTACTIAGSGWGGSYESEREAKLSFVGCHFGSGESNGWYFRNDAVFENCEWSEITSYPDREGAFDEYFGFYPENMEQVTLDDGILGHTCWIGCMEIDPQSGETEYFGLMGQDVKPALLITLDLNSDGTGNLAFGTEAESIQWEFMDGGIVCQRSDGTNAFFYLYRMHEPEGEYYRDWLMMQYGGNNLIWLY